MIFWVGKIRTIKCSKFHLLSTFFFCNHLASYDRKIVDGGSNDIRIVGIPAILLMVIICAVGMDWESKAQNFLVTTIFAAILVYIIGTLIGPTSDQERAEGFVGFSCKF